MTNATTDIGAMSAEELDDAIAQLRRRQKALAPDWQLPALSGFGFGEWHKPPGIKLRGWHQDAANLRGDVERVGADMRIGMLRAAQARKTIG